MHHANLFVGSRVWALPQTPFFGAEGNPDLVYKTYERMSITDVRALIHEAMLRPVHESHRTFIIATDSVLEEAQNALLKLFEEPNEHTTFYLIVPKMDMLLPTLLSRLDVLKIEERGSAHDSFHSFCRLSYSERITCIAEKLKNEDTAWVQEIVSGCELYAHTARDANIMREVLILVTYISKAGSSKKMLLEHIALTL